MKLFEKSAEHDHKDPVSQLWTRQSATKGCSRSNEKVLCRNKRANHCLHPCPGRAIFELANFDGFRMTLP